jgi:hypothetical protein
MLVSFVLFGERRLIDLHCMVLHGVVRMASFVLVRVTKFLAFVMWEQFWEGNLLSGYMLTYTDMEIEIV